MQLICEKSIGRRRTVGVIAFTWLLLQALTPLGAMAGHAMAANTGVVCVKDFSGSEEPVEHHAPGLCCIVACSACVCGYIANPGEDDHFQQRLFVSIRWTNIDARVIARARGAYFTARGPPAFF
jgi:hypothetical protein